MALFADRATPYDTVARESGGFSGRCAAPADTAPARDTPRSGCATSHTPRSRVRRVFAPGCLVEVDIDDALPASVDALASSANLALDLDQPLLERAVALVHEPDFLPRGRTQASVSALAG